MRSVFGVTGYLGTHGPFASLPFDCHHTMFRKLATTAFSHPGMFLSLSTVSRNVHVRRLVCVITCSDIPSTSYSLTSPLWYAGYTPILALSDLCVILAISYLFHVYWYAWSRMGSDPKEQRTNACVGNQRLWVGKRRKWWRGQSEVYVTEVGQVGAHERGGRMVFTTFVRTSGVDKKSRK